VCSRVRVRACVRTYVCVPGRPCAYFALALLRLAACIRSRVCACILAYNVRICFRCMLTKYAHTLVNVYVYVYAYVFVYAYTFTFDVCMQCLHKLSKMYAHNVCIHSRSCVRVRVCVCVCMCACVPGRPCACIASAPWGLAACSRLRAQFAKRAYTPLEYRYPFCLCNHVMNMLQILSYVAAVCCSAMREKSLHAS